MNTTTIRIPAGRPDSASSARSSCHAQRFGCSNDWQAPAGSSSLDTGQVWLPGATKVEARWGQLSPWGLVQVERRITALDSPSRALTYDGAGSAQSRQAAACVSISATLARAGLADDGTMIFEPLRRVRTHRRADKSGRYRWYNDYQLPTHLGAGTLTVRLHGNAEDTARKLNRTENLRPIPPPATPTSNASSDSEPTPNPSTAASKTPSTSAVPTPTAGHDNTSTSSAGPS